MIRPASAAAIKCNNLGPGLSIYRVGILLRFSLVVILLFSTFIICCIKPEVCLYLYRDHAGSWRVRKQQRRGGRNKDTPTSAKGMDTLQLSTFQSVNNKLQPQTKEPLLKEPQANEPSGTLSTLNAIVLG